MAIRIKARAGESAEGLLRRFEKMFKKRGLTKDVKRQAYYEKPSERARRALRKSIQRALMLSGQIPGGRPMPFMKGGRRGPGGGGRRQGGGPGGPGGFRAVAVADSEGVEAVAAVGSVAAAAEADGARPMRGGGR